MKKDNYFSILTIEVLSYLYNYRKYQTSVCQRDPKSIKL